MISSSLPVALGRVAKSHVHPLAGIMGAEEQKFFLH
jgi:hypothetical protein